MYSEKVMDHFMNPRHVGTIENPDGVGKVGNPVCGDMMEFYIKVKDNKLDEVKFKTFGCGAAIAVSSMVTEMAIGKTIEEALAMTNKDVAVELDGLPKNKMHCSNLGAEALHAAINDYLSKTGNVPTPDSEADFRPKAHSCPYCDEKVSDTDTSCPLCNKSLEKKQ